MSEEAYWEIMALTICKRAGERAVNILKGSDKTELGLGRKLWNGFYLEKATDSAIGMLKDCWYVDDENYATRCVETQGNKKSKRQLSFDLEKKGTGWDAVTRLLEDNSVDEESQIRGFSRKKHYEPDRTEQEERARLAATLGRKGSSFESIERAMAVDFDEESF